MNRRFGATLVATLLALAGAGSWATYAIPRAAPAIAVGTALFVAAVELSVHLLAQRDDSLERSQTRERPWESRFLRDHETLERSFSKHPVLLLLPSVHVAGSVTLAAAVSSTVDGWLLPAVLWTLVVALAMRLASRILHWRVSGIWLTSRRLAIVDRSLLVLRITALSIAKIDDVVVERDRSRLNTLLERLGAGFGTVHVVTAGHPSEVYSSIRYVMNAEVAGRQVAQYVAERDGASRSHDAEGSELGRDNAGDE